jgi:hemerythrin
MEARALYERFENNLNTIIEILNAGIDLQRTPFPTTLPLEVNILCTVLNTTGEHFAVQSSGIEAVAEFKDLYMHNKEHASVAMQSILNDKRSYLKTPEGTLLTKEVLIRRLEYFNEAARTLNVMATQQALHSPLQYKYPHLAAKN